MPPLLRYLLTRILALLVTMLVVTAMLYGVVMLTPPETRAQLYMPKKFSPRMTEEQYQAMLERMIETHHLNDPFPVQYASWIGSLLRGNWGYSPTMQEDILSAIQRRVPVTAELTLYSVLLFIPLGLISGVLAAARRNRPLDFQFRMAAFLATSLPPFILALIMMAVFYVQLGWFAPGRASFNVSQEINSDAFRQVTGLLTVDGLLNRRPDISLDALRHLVMPVVTLALSHWATLGRITRVTMIEETHKEYVTAARARGIPEPRLIWRHMLRNALAPSLTSSLLSAAALVTGVFVVEIIFNMHGISAIAVRSMNFIPDAPAALGFAVYSVSMVLLLMIVLDVVQALVDPRIRAKGGLE